MPEFIHQKKISNIYMTYSVDIVAPVLLCGDNIFGVVIRDSFQISEFSFDGFLFGKAERDLNIDSFLFIYADEVNFLVFIFSDICLLYTSDAADE